MYRIFADGHSLGICEKPNYVKRKNNLWIQCKKEDAEAISVNGVAYQDAIVSEVDGGEFLYNLFKDLTKNLTTTDDLQDAICQLSEEFEERINEIEDKIGGIK